MQKNLPYLCPSCASPLSVKSMVCGQCHTEVSGVFELPVLAKLSAEEQKFIIDFVKSSGSLKIMAQQLGLSYPTVRNLLDDIIQKVEDSQKTRK
jgi:hypothetical protein